MRDRRRVRGGRWRAIVRLRRREMRYGPPSAWRTVTFSYTLEDMRLMLTASSSGLLQ